MSRGSEVLGVFVAGFGLRKAGGFRLGRSYDFRALLRRLGFRG